MRPEILPLKIALLALKSPSNRNGAFPSQEPNHRGHGVFLGNLDVHMHMTDQQMSFDNLTSF